MITCPKHTQRWHTDFLTWLIPDLDYGTIDILLEDLSPHACLVGVGSDVEEGCIRSSFKLVFKVSYEHAGLQHHEGLANVSVLARS